MSDLEPMEERGYEVRGNFLPPENAAQSEMIPDMREIGQYMQAEWVRGNTIGGRIPEPVSENLVGLKRLFDEYGLVAYFARLEDKHVITYGPRPRLAPPKRWVNLVLLLATILSTLLVGSLQMGHNPFRNPLELVFGVPFSLSIILILGSHELAHYLTARRLGVDATLPYFLPVPHPMTGTMGAFIRMRSAVPSKGALVRVGVAGPLVGFLAALPVTIVGLSQSQVVSVGDASRGIQLGTPLVFGLLSRLWFGELGPGKDIVLHPVAFAGWLGFFVTALNLLPAGQLDGGHIAYAVFGRFRELANWAVIGLLVLAGYFWLGWPFWAVMISLFGLKHPPPLDDITPLSRTEKLLALAALGVLVLCFTPAPFGQARF
ncbi:MAG: site-2 protease family protein [candidate division WOR-3 bacterium]